MENPSNFENRETPKVPVRPMVEYDPKLAKEDVPYVLSVDTEKCALLMHELGVPDRKIMTLKIRLSTRSKRSFRVGRIQISTFGLYNLINNSLSIYGDPFWQQYKKHLERTEKPDAKGENPKKSFAGFLFTKKLRDDSEKTASIDMSTDSSQGSVSGAINRNLIGVFLHESKHLSDSRTLKHKLLRVTLGLGTLGGIGGVGLGIQSVVPIEPLNTILGLSISAFSAPIYYVTDPYEKRANRFEAKNKNDSRWQNLITITPKQKQ